MKVRFLHFSTNCHSLLYSQNPIISFEYVDFLPKFQPSRTHHQRNFITELTCGYSKAYLFSYWVLRRFVQLNCLRLWTLTTMNQNWKIHPRMFWKSLYVLNSKFFEVKQTQPTNWVPKKLNMDTGDRDCRYIDSKKHNFSLYIISHVFSILVVNECIKCNETTALNTSFTCKKMQWNHCKFYL